MTEARQLDHPRPHLFDVDARKEIPVPDDLLPNPYELTDFRWEPGSRRFTFLYNQRGHQVGKKDCQYYQQDDRGETIDHP